MAEVALSPLLIPELDARRLLGGVSAKTIYVWREREHLPYLKVGARVLYDPADLAAWVEARKGNGGPTA